MSECQEAGSFRGQLTELTELTELTGRASCGHREELHRHRKQLEKTLTAEIKTQRAEHPIQRLSVCEEEPPEGQEWGPGPDHKDTETKHFKEEQEELMIRLEEEHLHVQQEADFTPDPVKSEEAEEKLQSSQIHHVKTEQLVNRADGKDCEGSEQERDSNSERDFQPEVEVKIEDSSEPESEDQLGIRGHPSGPNSLGNRRTKRTNPDRKSHSCSNCGKTFKKKSNLTTHLRVHTGEQPFSCLKCAKRFTHKGSLNTHMRIHTGEKLFNCSECNKTFSRKTYLTTHMRIHSGEKPFSCSVCGKSFSQQGSMTIHMRLHTKEELLNCSVCNKIFNRKTNLIRHMKIHTGEKPFSCSVCGKTFNEKGNMTKHEMIHSGEKPFSCSECGKKFNDKKNMIRHKRVHLRGKPFSCSVCNRRFFWHFHLRRHKCVVHAPKPHESEQARDFNPERLLLPEIEVEIEEDFSELEADGSELEKETTADTQYSNSERPRAHKTSLSCPQCRKVFKTKGHLRQHIRTHTGEKPFSCSECGKRFNDKGYLNKHMRVHTGEKPFSCPECGKNFNQKSNLKIHMAHHRGEKPFSCKMCDQRFSWSSQLRIHKCAGAAMQHEKQIKLQEDEEETGVSQENCYVQKQGGTRTAERDSLLKIEVKTEEP